jgi:hypothetical protein
MVPVFAMTKQGGPVFNLKADDFLLTDNGIPQLLSLEEDTDLQPLAVAIVVETGGAGATHLADYRELDSILDALIGNVEHRVAVVAFDGQPHLILPFSRKTEDASSALASLSAGDHDAAILDAHSELISDCAVNRAASACCLAILSCSRVSSCWLLESLSSR